jgi:hypothetical protein
VGLGSMVTISSPTFKQPWALPAEKGRQMLAKTELVEIKDTMAVLNNMELCSQENIKRIKTEAILELEGGVKCAVGAGLSQTSFMHFADEASHSSMSMNCLPVDLNGNSNGTGLFRTVGNE